MKRVTGFAIIVVLSIVFAACAPPPITLTPEQIQSLSLATTDIPGAYEIDATYTGVITVQSLLDEGSVETADYVKSVEGIRMYRTAFKASTSAAGPLVIWNWVLVYPNTADAHGYFAAHEALFPSPMDFSADFPKLGQESSATYTTSDDHVFQLSHVIMRERNLVVYEAMLYEAGKLNEDEVRTYAQSLETKLQDVISSQ
jgi:hypothetical protein